MVREDAPERGMIESQMLFRSGIDKSVEVCMNCKS